MTATADTMVPADRNELLDLTCRALIHLGHAETFVEIAESLGISDSYLNNMRHGNKKVSDDHFQEILKKLRAHYDVGTDVLWDEEVQVALGVRESDAVDEEPEDQAAQETEGDGPHDSALTETFPEDRIAVKHGDLHFDAARREDGTWSIHAKLRDDEIVRILAMSAYRDLFGAAPDHSTEEDS